VARALAGELTAGLAALRADRVLTRLLTVSALFLLGIADGVSHCGLDSR
jgi:hypothetical protein